MHASRTRVVAVAGALAVAALAVTTACTPGGTGTTPTEGSTGISTDVAAAGDVTIRMSDFWGSAEQEWVLGQIEAFTTEYPNVTIDRTQEDWGQLISTLNLQLSEADGPCIATANNGWGSLGTLAKGGLVLNLDEYAAAYGWDDLIPETIARQNQFTTDFATIGAGSLFATPVARVSMIGVYYNVELLAGYGIETPTTLAELEEAATAIKAAGGIPFSYGSLDGGTAVLLGVQATHGTADAINDFVFADTSVAAADTGLLEAAETVKRWADAGWFPPDFEGIDYNTGLAGFLDGQGVFRFEYTGSLGLTDDQQGAFGYLQLPQVDDPSTTVGVGAAPGALVISSECEHPDVAAAFLDQLMSAEAAQAAVDLGMIPLLHADVSVPEGKATLQQEVAGSVATGGSDGFVPYFDWASATLFDTLNQNLQELYAGMVTPQQLVDAVDADRAADLAGRAG